jgi:hypothetical protein
MSLACSRDACSAKLNAFASEAIRSPGAGAVCTIATGKLVRSFLKWVKVSIPSTLHRKRQRLPRECPYLPAAITKSIFSSRLSPSLFPSNAHRVHPKLRLSDLRQPDGWKWIRSGFPEISRFLRRSSASCFAQLPDPFQEAPSSWLYPLETRREHSRNH